MSELVAAMTLSAGPFLAHSIFGLEPGICNTLLHAKETS